MGENAYVYLAAYNRAARKAGVPKDAIEKVLDDAMSGDYDHLRATLRKAGLAIR